LLLGFKKTLLLKNLAKSLFASKKNFADVNYTSARLVNIYAVK